MLSRRRVGALVAALYIHIVGVDANVHQCSAGRSIRDGSCNEGAPMDVHEIPCTGPIEAKDLFGSIDFEQVYWRKRPVLIRRHCSETYDNLALGDLSRMFPDAIAGGEENGQVQLSSFRAGDEYVRIIRFYSNIFLGYLDGASVVYNQVDTMWSHGAQFIKGKRLMLHLINLIDLINISRPNQAWGLRAVFPFDLSLCGSRQVSRRRFLPFSSLSLPPP